MPRKRLAFLAVGFLLWGVIFFLVGPAAVLTSLGRGLRAFGTVLVLSAAAQALRAAAWKIALSREGHGKASLVAVLAATLAVGGTPLRLAALKKKTGIADGAGSVVTDQSVRSLAAMIFVGLGFILGFLFVPGNVLVRGLMLTVALGGFAFVVIATGRRRGFFMAILDGLRARWLSPAVRGRLEERDRFLKRFQVEHPSAFWASLLIHLAIFGLSALEIFVLGRAMDAYFPGALALGLAAFLPLIRLVFSFVPAALGVLEGSLVWLLSALFGAPLAALGVGLVLLLRLRTLFWWLVGLVVTGNPLRLLFGR